MGLDSLRQTETKIVKINGEDVECEVIDLMADYGEALKTADRYRKTAVVDARQASGKEIVSTSQDGMTNYADPGDWIIKNPGDKDPYVFGDKTKKAKNENGEEVVVPVTVEERQKAFAKKYEPIADQPGKFRAKGIIRALKVDRNIVFKTSWGEEMATKAGGWVADGGYCIAENSFNSTYEKIEDEK